MGLKLKWFRRRITFEGIPPAPERNIRKKEHNTGVPVAGVYRQSLNFEDYIVSNSSIHWTSPPNQQRVSPIRELDTSHSSSSAIANNLHGNDKITPSGRCIETPPEPSYSPPKPPARRAKSTLNLKATANDTEPTAQRLEEKRSEVPNNDARRVPISPAPRTTGINYNQSQSPVETNSSDPRENGQPEFVNDREPSSTLHQDTKSFDDIFEKNQTKPTTHTVDVIPNNYMEPLSSTLGGSIESIFEPRPEEMAVSLANFDTNTVPETERNSPEAKRSPLKSILKKRAPVPPQPQTISVESSVVPTPPPRSIRRKESKLTTDEEDDDGYLNWNLVDRHRSSISHTVSAKINPEIVRNVPASLQIATQQTAPTAQSGGFLDEPPKTLRGMRNRRVNQQQQNTSRSLTLEARDSVSNASEASA
ncbi:uncharacterized protein LOC129767445 [Toxorhynchites rutilus septentrionalis]|uniref:uncharacterized protein LOC129767445 n=1 Tax=Toxorhynchites rutilus septentrionalis TaxID=329112 RepID=UPI002479AAC6|nr:uncharacterized protein LOC129767445 [Toxorhynchites rutilus septentrionalis]